MVLVKDCEVVGEIVGQPVYRVKEVKFLPFVHTSSAAALDEQRLAQTTAVEKFLQAGDIYFSPTYNLTRCGGAPPLPAARRTDAFGAQVGAEQCGHRRQRAGRV